jgi:putative ABC transport system permease protein
MHSLLQDFRFAVRILLKSPGFAVIAVLCLAIGIGANTTIFSVVNAILLRPFPYADPESIVAVRETQVKNDIERARLSYLDYQDLREQNVSFAQTAAYAERSLTFSGTEEPERLLGCAISSSLFPLLGIKPALGRTFRADEDRPGAPGAVLLSHELWMRRFNGDPSIIGKTIIVNAAGHTVVGVMPPRFRFPENELAWVPLTPWVYKDPRQSRDLSVIARLKPGTTVEQARADVAGIVERIAAQFPDTHSGWSANAESLRDDFAGKNLRTIVFTMMGAVVCVLLIACSNVANLLLARATVRQREVAVRAAFGAGRLRLLRQLLTESVLIGLAGGALGIVFAVWGIRWIELSIPANNQPPYWMVFNIDGTVLLYTLGIAVATGLLFGLAPALQALKPDLHETLKEGGRGAGGSLRKNRLRSLLVVAQVALSLVLLITASLFVRSFLKLQEDRGGFATSHLLTLRFYMPAGSYEKDEDMTRRVQDVVRRVEAVPGVEAVSASNNIPLGGGGDYGRVLIEGKDFPRGEEPRVFYAGVTPHFFKALGLGLSSGQSFRDREGFEISGVAVVNQTFARKFWPREEPLGRRFRLPDNEHQDWIRVIGVAPDFKNQDLDSKLQPSAYVSYAYEPSRNTGLTIRTRANPLQAVPAVRQAIRASNPDLPVFDVYTMEQVRRQGFWEYRFFGAMFSVFGGLALFLAAIGLYGVLSYSVSQRVREIGVRVALGAQNGHVMRLVLRQGMLLALFGIGFGLLFSFGATRVVASILYDTSPTDPLSFAAISAALASIAALACYLPARRALEVDPLESLRSE